MRVLVAPDKFKGSLTAAEVSQAIAEGLGKAGVASRMLPLADGGDGSVAAALFAGFSPHPTQVTGADGRLLDTLFATDGHTAVVEVATTCGLATLSGGLQPMTSSSYGFGEAIRAALASGCRRVVLALGGSASTDGGAGMLAALGVGFSDATGHLVEPSGATLHQVSRVDVSELTDLSRVELVVAGDVTNPLLGPDGAAAVFGPQKGADPEQVPALDADLQRFVELLPRRGGQAPGLLAGEPGAGAAGGLGFACRWLGGTRVPGADFFLDLLGFDRAVASCDVVITGEGCLDSQTLNGKLPVAVSRRSAPRPVHAVVGISLVDAGGVAELGMQSVHAVADMTSDDTRSDPELSRALVTRAGKLIGRRLLSGPAEAG